MAPNHAFFSGNRPEVGAFLSEFAFALGSREFLPRDELRELLRTHLVGVQQLEESQLTDRVLGGILARFTRRGQLAPVLHETQAKHVRGWALTSQGASLAGAPARPPHHALVCAPPEVDEPDAQAGVSAPDVPVEAHDDLPPSAELMGAELFSRLFALVEEREVARTRIGTLTVEILAIIGAEKRPAIKELAREFCSLAEKALQE